MTKNQINQSLIESSEFLKVDMCDDEDTIWNNNGGLSMGIGQPYDN
jgi:hypothetical protein